MRPTFRKVIWPTLACAVIFAAVPIARADDSPNAYVLAVGVDRHQHAQKVTTPWFVQKDRLTAQDPVDKIRQGCYRKVFHVKLAGGKHVIDLMSGDGRAGPHNPGYFDTYLRLEDGAGKEIESNDDGGEGTNSRIYLEAPEGCHLYRLVVTSYSAGATGNFVLRVQRQE